MSDSVDIFGASTERDKRVKIFREEIEKIGFTERWKEMCKEVPQVEDAEEALGSFYARSRECDEESLKRKEAEEKLWKLEEKYAELEEANLELVEEKRAQDELVALAMEKAAELEESADLSYQLEEERKKCAKLEDENASLAYQVSELLDRQRVLEDSDQEARKQCTEFWEGTHNLNEWPSVSELKVTENNNVSGLEADYAKLEEEKNSLAKDLQVQITRNAGLEADKASLQSEKEKMWQILSQLMADKASVDQELGAERQRMRDLVREVEEKRAALEKEKRSVKQLRIVDEELNKKVLKLKKSCFKLKEEKKVWAVEKESLLKSLNSQASVEDVGESEQNVRELKVILDSERARIERLEEKAEKSKVLMEDKEELVKYLQGEVDKYEILEDVKEEVSSVLKCEIAQLRSLAFDMAASSSSKQVCCARAGEEELHEKIESLRDLINQLAVTQGEKTANLMEQQETLLELLKETMSSPYEQADTSNDDEGYEVVGEI